MNFNFKEAYGKEFDEMSQDEKMMAIMSQLYYLNKCVGKMKWTERAAYLVAFIVPWLAFISVQFFLHVTG